MVDMNHINSAEAYARAVAEEEREKRNQELKDFRKEQIAIATIEELKKQNQLLVEQNKNAQAELLESKKTNRKMFIVALASLVVAVVGVIVTIVVSLVK